MAWSGGTFTRTNGTYTGASVWASDEGAAIDIESARHDTHDQDLATGINACVNKDGSNAAGVVTESWLADDACTRSTMLYTLDALGIADGTAAITEYAYRRPMPKSGKVTHITANIQQTTGATITGGTLTFTVYKNGVTTGKDVQLTTGQSSNVGGIPTGQFSFAAGDLISVALTKASVTMTAGSQFFEVQVWGHFIE